MDQPLRVLHCPKTVGGHAWAVSRMERKLGLISDVMIDNQDWIGQASADIDLELYTLPSNLWGRFKRMWRLFRFLIWSLSRYDVYHFNFGRTILDVPSRGIHYWDLPLLKLLGKRVIMTYQGSDLRVGFGQREGALNGSDEIKLRRAAIVQRYADHIFVMNPDLGRFCPQAEFRPYSKLDLNNDWKMLPFKESLDKFIIVHAPTKRGGKGTRYVIEACQALKESGYAIELALIENMPRSQARKIYEQADIAVDQLLIGWYGGFATEMMALGKPVVCYIKDDDLEFVPAEMRQEIPIYNATPQTLVEALCTLMNDQELRRRLGLAGRAYVEKWHDPMRVAQRLVSIYYGESVSK